MSNLLTTQEKLTLGFYLQKAEDNRRKADEKIALLTTDLTQLDKIQTYLAHTNYYLHKVREIIDNKVSEHELEIEEMLNSLDDSDDGDKFDKPSNRRLTQLTHTTYFYKKGKGLVLAPKCKECGYRVKDKPYYKCKVHGHCPSYIKKGDIC